MSSTTATLPFSNPSFWVRAGWVLLLLGAILATANAAFFVAVPGYDDGIQRARMFEIASLGYGHTLGGAIAMLIGPFQFLGSLRRRHPRLHTWLGRAYLTCVGFSALAGLYLSPGSYARNTFGIAFVMLALAWLFTGTKAYLAIRGRNIAAHRRWMIRNYALTYAAVTLRFEMPLLIVAFGLSPIMALNIVGWLCWVPNLIIVEWWLRRRRTAPLPGAAPLTFAADGAKTGS
jgi:uncharacterized membrane protein